jgi:hypothetical protein
MECESRPPEGEQRYAAQLTVSSTPFREESSKYRKSISVLVKEKRLSGKNDNKYSIMKVFAYHIRYNPLEKKKLYKDCTLST